MNSKPTSRTIVVVLNWNSHEMTAECIRSLLAMGGTAFEILVVDNGSTDGSVELLPRQFPQISVLPQGRNLGFAAGCNIGMRLAMEQGAEFILLVNNDTIVDAGLLRELLTEAERNPEAAILSPKIYFFDDRELLWWAGGRFSLWTGIPILPGRKEKDRGQYDSIREIEWATGCVALLRVAALRQVGLFDERLFGNGEDLDLSIRVRQAGYGILYVPAAKLWHREGVDYRKNVGEYARYFTGTRNLLWLMHKHARPFHWITFWPNFLFRHVLFFILLGIWRGDVRSSKAVLQGIAAFVAMRANGGGSAMLPELTPRGGGGPAGKDVGRSGTE